MAINIAVKRVKREFQEGMKTEEFANCSIKLDLVDNCWTELRGEISGPPDTPYEGGKFLLEIIVPESYPFEPPKVKFLTKIWHPNISSATGAICLDILRDQWAAAMTLRTVLLSLQALLSSAEPNDPQDAVVANQFRKDFSMFVNTAKHWTFLFAGGPHRNHSFEDSVKRLVDLGVEQVKAVMALSMCDWDMEKSMEFLFN